VTVTAVDVSSTPDWDVTPANAGCPDFHRSGLETMPLQLR